MFDWVLNTPLFCATIFEETGCILKKAIVRNTMQRKNAWALAILSS